MYLSHLFSWVFAGQKQALPEQLTRTGEVFAFYQVITSESEQGDMNHSNLVTSRAHRVGREEMFGFCLDLDLIWQWTENPGSDDLEARWHAGLWGKAAVALKGPGVDLSPAFEWIVTRSQPAQSCNWYWSLNDPFLTFEVPTGLMLEGVYPWIMWLQESQCALAGFR